MLSAKADIPLGGDLEQDVYPIVVNPFRRQPVDVAFENQEVSPRIRLELSSNVYQPGETLEGKLTLLEGATSALYVCNSSCSNKQPDRAKS